MKKYLLYFLLLIINVNVFGQAGNYRITSVFKQTRTGGVYKLQFDSSGTGDYRDMASQNYVQGYVASHGGISYSQGQGIDISGGVISLNSISGFLAEGANVVITGNGTLLSPYTIAATGSGGAGSNANVGSAYRWAVANTQNIKTFANGVGFLLDSLTSNTLTGKVDTFTIGTRAWRQKGIDSITGLLSNYALSSSLSNYVPTTTLVSTGYGLLGGGQLNANRTHYVDSSVISTKLWRQKGIDSVIAATVQLNSFYSNPSWIQTLNWSKITSTPTTIAGYGITDYNSLWDTRLATKTTSNLTEGSNQYFTNTRSRQSISLSFTTTGSSGAATGSYDNSTGVMSINVPQYVSGGGLTGSLTVSLTDGATISTDASLGYTVGATYRVTLGGNRSIANPTNLTDGQRVIYEIKQDATGGRTVNWGSMFMWSNDLPVPVLSTTANYVDQVAFVYNQSANKLYVSGYNIGIH